MNLLLDQDVYALTERFLKALGHDVQTASFVVVEPKRHRYRAFGR